MNATCNAVTNGVTNAVLNGPRCWVQNQNQNQTVVKAVRGVSIRACIRRQGRSELTTTTMHASLRAEFGGGC